ncbi:MAG: hypothetical protein KGN31_06755 [Betaproteobacteria bacterium]|nr:hypothetical protein [Betaproteobacteria bacterium]MDE2423894.1 hypothetical protein [Betaproteobacteria bacterium]
MKKWESASSKLSDEDVDNNALNVGCPFYVGVAIVAVSWYCLFKLNQWLFHREIVSAFASWIFLPQILRLIAILLCGWRGAVGLFLGALLTGDYSTEESLIRSIILACMSSIGAYLAVYCFRWINQLPDSLNGLKGRHLWQLALLGATFNAIPTNIYLFLSNAVASWWESLLPMITGDWLGSAVMLYFLRFVQKMWDTHWVKKITQ